MSILSLASKVQAVTVYARGALVLRRAPLAAGLVLPSLLRLEALPLALEDTTVRARITDAAGAPVGHTVTQVHISIDAPVVGNRELPADDEELLKIRQEEDRLGRLLTQLDHELAAVVSLSIQPRPPVKWDAPPQASPTGLRLELMRFRRREQERLEQERAEVVRVRHEIIEKRRELEERHARRSTDREIRPNELRKAALVSVQSSTVAADAFVNIEYMVPGARWVPSYALDLTADQRLGELTLRAAVCQATGEDWTGVQLHLSTAIPQARSDLPELTSLRIGRRQPLAPRRGYVPPPDDAAELFADYERETREIIPPLPPPAVAAEAVALAPPPTAPAAVTTRQRIPELPGGVAESKMQVARRTTGVFASSSTSAPRARGLARSSGDDLAKMAYETADLRADGGMVSQARAAVSGPEEVTISADHLDFSRLRMPPPSAFNRGQLQVIPLGQLYLEAAQGLPAQARIDVGTALSAAIRRAEEVRNAGLPGRCVEPRPEGGFDYAYGAEHPLDIPSDGVFHSVSLKTCHSKVEMEHVTVPRHQLDVFRIAVLQNPLEAPLLRGPVNVSVAGEFRMTVPMPQTPPHGTVRLGLGEEPSLKVARNTNFREETAGLMGGTLGLEHEIRVEVVNNLPTAALLDVRERLPIPRDGDDSVKVVVREVDPAWQDYQDEDRSLKNGHVWRVRLEPREKKLLRVAYSIQTGAKNELIGGNRREG